MTDDQRFAPSEPSDMKAARPAQGTLTNAAGNTVPNNQQSQSAGPRGPLLLQDHHLLERMAHFNRERVPERVVHAKGGGAFGTFTVTGDISKYTNAKLFSQVGKQCRMLARFSSVAGEKGFADTVRDPRGFSLKFYTEDGNWDMVGNNTPVFFVRDPLKFQDFIHSQKRHPQTGRRSNTMMFDYWGHRPEALHQVVYMFGDRGIPRGYRFMNGYGSHTYSLWNDAGERYWVKWHFHSQQGVQGMTEEQAATVAGANLDYHLQDLFDAIERGEYPKWKVSVQIIPEKDAETYHTNIFDLTKTVSHKDYPLIEVGMIELNENPKNYFAEIEQAAFEPSNMPRGFGASPDKVLQGRLMSYADAHRYRIGINYAALPVNKALAPVNTYHRDGQQRFDGNFGDSPVYEPNSFGGPAETGGQTDEPALRIDGNADRYGYPETDEDLYGQPGELYRLMAPDAHARMHKAFAGPLSTVPDFVRERFVAHLYKIDSRLGQGVDAEIEKAKAQAAPELTGLLLETHTNASRPQQEAVGADD
jgi:catalase